MSFTIRALEDRIVFDAAPAVAAEPAAEAPADVPDRILVVDRAVDNAGDLAGAVLDGVTVVEYDSRTDTLADLRALIDAARGDGEYASIAFAGHGEAGRYVITADATLETGALAGDMALAEFFAYLGELLAEDGHVDLLGCDIASGTEGMELIDALEELTGIDFAASDDATGNESEGGDWFLETDDVDLLATYFDAEGIEKFEGLLAALELLDDSESPSTYYTTDGTFGEVADEATIGKGDSLRDLISLNPVYTNSSVGPDSKMFGFNVAFFGEGEIPVSILEIFDIPLYDSVPADDMSLFFVDSGSSFYEVHFGGMMIGMVTNSSMDLMITGIPVTKADNSASTAYDFSMVFAAFGSLVFDADPGNYMMRFQCFLNGDSPYESAHTDGMMTLLTVRGGGSDNNQHNQDDIDDKGEVKDGDEQPSDDPDDGGDDEGGDEGNNDPWTDIGDMDDTDDTDDGDSGDTDSTDNTDSDSRDFQETVDSLADFIGSLDADELEELEIEDLDENVAGLSDNLGDLDSQIGDLLALLGASDPALSGWLDDLSNIGAQLKRDGALAAAMLVDAIKSWRTTPVDMRDGMARDLISGLNRYIASINVRIKSALFSLQTLAELVQKNKESGRNVPMEQLLAQVEDARAKWEAALAESMEMRDRMYFDLKDADAMTGR